MKSEIKEARKRAAQARKRVALQQAVEIFQRLGSEPLSELTASAAEKNLKALMAKKREGLRIAGVLMELGEPLPERMRIGAALYLQNEAGMAAPPRRRGPKPEGYREGRNALIVIVIEYVCDHWFFPATRNEASSHPSAALIAKRALEAVGVHLTESAVNSIWREWDAARALSLLPGPPVTNIVTRP
jgi:hypothetical protein